MTLTILTILLSWLVGSFVGGLTGIGTLMIVLPVLTFVLPVQVAILVCCLTVPAIDVVMCVRYWSFCRWKSLVPLYVGLVPGALVGLWILTVLPARLLEGSLGVLLLIFLLWQQVGHVSRGGEGWLSAGIAGGLSGLLGTAISVDGPPVGAYGLYAGWSPTVYLGTLYCYFIIRSLVTCVLQAGAGLYTPDVLQAVLWSIPAAVLGTILSFPVVNRIRASVFRSVVKLVIALGGIVCIVHALA